MQAHIDSLALSRASCFRIIVMPDASSLAFKFRSSLSRIKSTFWTHGGWTALIWLRRACTVPLNLNCGFSEPFELFSGMLERSSSSQPLCLWPLVLAGLVCVHTSRLRYPIRITCVVLSTCVLLR